MRLEYARNDLREYFANSRLSYDHITLHDLRVLEAFCNMHFARQQIENLIKHQPVYWVSVNAAKFYKGKYQEDGKLICAFLTGKGGHFHAREVISFNQNGFIGFCAEAGDRNLQPVAAAFTEWCEYLKCRRTTHE